MVPRTSNINKKIEKILKDGAMTKENGMLPVYAERGVYNFYLKKGAEGSISAIDDRKLEDYSKEELIKVIEELRVKVSGLSAPGGPGQPRA